MNNLKDYINNAFLIESLKEIDGEIISEKLNCKILIDIANQLKSIKDADIADQQEKAKNDVEENPEREKYYTKTKDGKKYKISSRNKSFREIFGNRMVMLDKLSDSDVTVYEADDENHDKIIRNASKGNGNKIIILQDPKTEQYKFYIDNWGYIVYLFRKKSGYSWHGDEPTGEKEMTSYGSRYRRWKDIKVSEKVELCKNLRIYVIDCSKALSDKIRTERNNRQSGIIWFDEGSLKQYAKDNVERYKKIVSQNRANRLKDDKLLNEVEAIIKKVAELAVECAKDPILNADIVSTVSQLCNYIYDTRVYHAPRSYKDQGWYSGVNGLIPQLKKYTEYLGRLKKRGNEYDQGSFNDAKKNLEKAVEECHKLLKSIDEDI